MCRSRPLTHNRAMSRIYDRAPSPPSNAPGAPELPSSSLHREDGDDGGAIARAPLMRWVRRRGSPVQGNLVDLLCNGQEYFPALIEAIDTARVHVVLETYIYADDDV